MSRAACTQWWGSVSDSRIMRVTFAIVPAFFAVLTGCSESTASGPADTGAAAPAGFVVSDVTGGSTSASLAAATLVSTETNTVYVSALPGTFASASSVEIRNKTTGGAPVGIQLINGGFDPIAVEAHAGDELSITVNNPGGPPTLVFVVVPKRRPPEVVRTAPPKGRTDVALNVQVEVVFSEPVNRRTVTSSSLILTQDGSNVPGTVSVSDDGLRARFTPDTPLQPSREYSFIATDAVRDLDGDPLVNAPPTTFTTVPPTVGTVLISLATSSADPNLIDPDGYTLRVDSGREMGVPVNGTLSIEDLPVGPHSIELGGLAANCSLADDRYSTATVQISGGVTSRVSFSVICEERIALSGVLAFVSERDGNPEIYRMNADGTGLARLTNHPGSDIDPAWSPDGKRIAFVSDRDGSPNIYVMNADGTNVVRRTVDGTNDSPAWSPDGKKIVFSSLRGGWFSLYTMDVDGNWGAPTRVGPDTGWNAYPSWSPDGKRIVFTSDFRAYDFAYDLLSINADGSDQQWLLLGPFFSPNQRYYYQAAWSPDGSKIALVECQNSREYCFPGSSVSITNADGSGLRNVAASAGYSSPAWSPDGRFIAFGIQPCNTCEGSIRVVSADGTHRGLITSDGYSPSWTR